MNAGGTDGYTITIHNPNASAVPVNSITDTLPAGFAYVAGSTTGATTSNPTIASQTLTWSSSFNVAAGGDITLHFNVTAASTAGMYFNNAGADAGAVAVAPTGDTAPITVQSAVAPTTLTVPAATGDFADPTTVTAVLTSNAAPVPGKSVSLTLNGVEACSATTDATGTASCSITPGEAAGTYPLVANFAGDASFAASTGVGMFTVTLEETGLDYTGDTSAVNGQQVTLAGHLTTDDPAGAALPGKLITFTLGTGGTAQSCTATTDAGGIASCTIASVSQTAGAVGVSAAFAGDTFYQSATATASVKVFPAAATGAFVIGDISAGAPTAGNQVYFWGSQWARRNSQSGGGAPNAMKGFADSPTNVTCGATWTARPGGSSNPPPSLPGQIAVIVSSDVTKKGSTVSGTILHIVVVQVDPGYGPDPGDAGTGTIVGTIC